ncbi:MAG: hypothetical protein ABI882_16220 [Acidobacteriota bacterium]
MGFRQMRLLVPYVLLAGTVLASPAPGFAQQTKPAAPLPKASATADKEPPAEEPEITRLQQRAISIIRETARDAVTLEDRRTIARIQARSATAIWKFDVENARDLCEKAFETALAHYRETKDTGSERRPSGLNVQRADVRQEVIRAVSRHDPAMAKTMTERFIEERQREMAEQRTDQVRDDRLLGKNDPAGEQLLTLASSLLKTDREAAVELARRGLASSIPSFAASFLVSLANLDRKAADQLYLFALGRLAAQETPIPGQLLVLAAYPFGDDRIFISDGNSTSSIGFGKPKDFAIDVAVVRSFFAIAVDVLGRAARLDTAQFPDLVARVNSALFAARLLEGKVAQYEPSLAEKWPVLISSLHGVATEAGRGGVGRTLENVAKEMRPPTVAESEDRIKALLDQAEKTSDFARRDEIYNQAAQAARRAGDMSRAMSIADKISDMEFRQNVRDWLNFDAANDALSAKRIDEAHRYALDVSVSDQRAYLLFQIAKALLSGKDRGRAIDMLEEAARKASSADNTAEKLRALLGISNVYAGIDPSRAFEIATEAMKVAGKVPDYGPDTTSLFRSLNRKGGGSTSYSTSSADEFDVGKTLSVLARADLERALNLAQSIESKPLQLLTIVAVASSLLESK